MGLLDDLHVPYSTDADAVDKCNAIMDKCKVYYEDLLEAKLSANAYIICYQHAQESIDFAVSQFQQAYDEFDTSIEDTNKADILKALKEAIEESRKIQTMIDEKIEDLNAINTKLAEYLTRVADINNEADKTLTAACILATPIYPYY